MRSALIPAGYKYNEATSVWIRQDYSAIAYSDGDEVEVRIASIIENAADLGVLSDELRQHCTDWPSLYHLSGARSNILRPFEAHIRGDILEIGAGCGAITRYLGESGGNVLALEGSPRRAAIARARTRDLDNVAVVSERFDDFSCDKKFDVVTLIGVLEYARKYFTKEAGEDPVAAMLTRARSMLKPGGVLLLAIENQLGLKYFAGRPEDHNGVPMYGIEDLYGNSDAVTFGEQELRSLLSAAGWEHQRWWYPFPDYKFPISILSESGVRAPADLTPLLQNSVLADPQRGATSFSLESAWAPVFRNGLAGALANSFAVLASDRPLPQAQALAYHYASARRQSFAKEVAFLQDAAGEILVEHRPLVPSASAAAPAADGLKMENERAAFVFGQHWQKELVRIVNRPGWSMAELQSWAATWLRAFLRHAGLADGHELSKDTRIAGDHFDAVPRNLIVRALGGAVFIDQEWHLDEPCTLGFLVFRSLGLSFFGVVSVAQAAPQVSLALQDILFGLARAVGIPLSEDDLPSYVDLENAIQSRVGMQSSEPLTVELLAQWHLNVRIASWNPENVCRLETEVARRDVELAHLGAEVHRLETVVLAKDQQLQEVGQKLEVAHDVILHKDQGLTHQASEIARLEAALQDKDQRLQALGFEMNRLQVESVQDMDRLRHNAAQEAEVLRESMAARSVRVQELESEIAALLERTDAERHYFYAEVAKRDKLLAEGDACQNQLKAEWQRATAALQVLRMSRWFRLREILLTHPFGFRKVLLLAVTVGGGLLPRAWRAGLKPRLQRLFGLAPVAAAVRNSDTNAYQLKVPPAAPARAPRIVHAIANFMTGGSSRLVIDLVEHLGSQYRQTVLTSFNPDPPAYVGVDIEECRFPQDIGPLVAYFQRARPDIVHVHYWGDCDEPWYAKVIEATKHLGLPIIENINTPIAPHRSEAVVRYVYVSDYVRRAFGSPDAEHVTVYPGSDFALFTRGPAEQAPSDCVGMVYRLERDKLNEEAIQPFIRIAQLRPQTRILIVGGGSLYEPYREAVAVAGVAENFEFTGYVSYEQLPALYRQMSLFVAPVWKESFGQVSPFAMSMKVPVIGYDIGAIGEIVGDPSLLAPPADPEALARIAVALLDAPEKLHRLGEMQQRRAQDNFSIQAMIAHYARIYAEVSKQARKDSA